ncbi:hypothetical protein [Caulobacter sp. RHG1]|uniref:hypothetical protein n=1 Tax=Caulobacter sp. (strain RHG1) TaxID=2545762 RepID=UPI001555D672|nr:hypothetical protein [Caulobacter sp. RHG1]NQE62923.1 hypothetical protein [Caulobacter sp. RHG1]
MSAFAHIVTDWTPLVGGLCGFAAFGEMLWRKLVVGPRAAQRMRAATQDVRDLRTHLRNINERQSSPKGGPNAG